MAAVQRFVDAEKESIVGNRPSSIDFANIDVLPLDQVLLTTKDQVANIKKIVSDAKKRWTRPNGDLSVDESFAIYLYTMEQRKPQKDICALINESLRSKVQFGIENWYYYLALLMSALNKLESVSCKVYRGARGDLSSRYQQEHVWWLGFNTCTKSTDEMDKMLGPTGVRTVFVITCINGKSLGKHSYQKNENEVVLLPGTYLRVVEQRTTKTKLHIIYLQEEIPPNDQSASASATSTAFAGKESADKDGTTMKNRTDGHGSGAESHAPHRSPQTHPACQFQAEQRWFERQHHQNENRSIKKPDQLQKDLHDPPSAVHPTVVDRITGSLMGMTLGDALGAHVEFRPRSFLLEHPVKDLEGGGTWGLQKGQFTDDTSMALCLGISLVVRRDFILYDQLVRYKWWYRNGYMSSTGECFDIGSATKQSIAEFEHRQQRFAQTYNIPLDQVDYLSDPRLLAEFNPYCSADGVAGNGALMRLAPVPIFFWQFPHYAVELSGQSALATHGDQKAYDACRYYAALIVAAVSGETKKALTADDFYFKHKAWFSGKALCPEIMTIAQGSYKREGGYDAGIRGKGYVVNTLEAALWAFYYDEESFEKGALDAVNLGDDTDTTAAIYGQLAGACYGYQNLPPEWLRQVYAKDFIICLSKWMAYEGKAWRPKSSVVRGPPLTLHLDEIRVDLPSETKTRNDAKPAPMNNSHASPEKKFPAVSNGPRGRAHPQQQKNDGSDAIVKSSPKGPPAVAQAHRRLPSVSNRDKGNSTHNDDVGSPVKRVRQGDSLARLPHSRPSGIPNSQEEKKQAGSVKAKKK